MKSKSTNAIWELRQVLPLLKELRMTFNLVSSVQANLENDTSSIFSERRWAIDSLERAYQRVRNLSIEIFGSSDNFDSWVGSKGPVGTMRIKKTVGSSGTFEYGPKEKALASKLHSYALGIVDNAHLGDRLALLIRENRILKSQLREIRQRELTYISMVEGAKFSTHYTPPQESEEFVLASLEREKMNYIKYLGKLKEREAIYGLDAPPDLLIKIENSEQQIKTIKTKINNLKKQLS
ncbi:MAG: hypothetical protein KDI79_20440 [Anaerolineae bacterium]|nr:hypothetical protein [Anaerolineae bacterium]